MVNWITKNLGTAAYHDCKKSGILDSIDLVDVREMIDGEGNNLDFVMEKIKNVQDSLSIKKKVVICCDKGISRSNSIALGALLTSGMSYANALSLISSKVDISEINMGLLYDIKNLFGVARKQKNKKISHILIYGAASFIGRALVKEISADYKLFCPTQEDIGFSNKFFLLDYYADKNNIDFVIYISPSGDASAKSMANSIVVTKNLLELCRLNKLGLLYISSLSAVGSAGNYGETKFLCEELVKIYQNKYKTEVAVVRPSMLYGEDMAKESFIFKFFEKAIKNDTIRTHKYDNGSPIFDFLYIDDFIKAIKKSLAIRPNKIINIGTGVGTSTFELAKKIKKIYKSSSGVETINVRGRAPKVVVDTKEAERVLGWRYSTSLNKGLGKIIKLSKNESN